MTSNIGYIRVSSNNQNTDRQLDGIILEKVFTEKQSGKSSNDRPQLQECLSWIRKGDTLHVHSIDRLARNLVDLQNLVISITAKGVTLKFHKEGLTFTGDSNNPMNKLLLQMLIVPTNQCRWVNFTQNQWLIILKLLDFQQLFKIELSLYFGVSY